jgi:hypothetical protein
MYPLDIAILSYSQTCQEMGIVARVGICHDTAVGAPHARFYRAASTRPPT